MTSTYSPNLRLELIGTGDQQGTWGITTNVNLGTLLEEAIGGYVTVTVSDATDTVLTTANGSADQSRNMVINLTGALTAARNVICPAIEKVYIVKNATTGGYPVTFKVTGQTGVSIPNGTTQLLYVNGVDAFAVTGTMASQDFNNVNITGGTITGITDLAIADGGTGASTEAGARTNLGLGSIATQNSNAVSITGGSISGITDLAVADGGTGKSSFDADGVVLGGTTSTGALQSVANPADSGKVLMSSGTGSTPTWEYVGNTDYSKIRCAVGTGGLVMQNIPEYYQLVIMFNATSTDTGYHTIELSSDNGTTYGSPKQITTSKTYGIHFGTVVVADANVVGPKTIYPRMAESVNGDPPSGVGIYNTDATESVITGVINCVRIKSTAANMAYSCTLFGTNVV